METESERTLVDCPRRHATARLVVSTHRGIQGSEVGGVSLSLATLQATFSGAHRRVTAHGPAPSCLTALSKHERE